VHYPGKLRVTACCGQNWADIRNVGPDSTTHVLCRVKFIAAILATGAATEPKRVSQQRSPLAPRRCARFILVSVGFASKE
jgi:hypothetical protein